MLRWVKQVATSEIEYAWGEHVYRFDLREVKNIPLDRYRDKRVDITESDLKAIGYETVY
jgi:hypothetical protein